jgi:hypothetical protein
MIGKYLFGELGEIAVRNAYISIACSSLTKLIRIAQYRHMSRLLAAGALIDHFGNGGRRGCQAQAVCRLSNRGDVFRSG